MIVLAKHGTTGEQRSTAQIPDILFSGRMRCLQRAEGLGIAYRQDVSSDRPCVTAGAVAMQYCEGVVGEGSPRRISPVVS